MSKKAEIENEAVPHEEVETCFVIMPISDNDDYPENHFTKIYENLFKPAIIAAGFKPYRVDENEICDSIINKIFDAIQNSAMCLCDLSSRNPNVLYELGLRQAYNKPVVLVQDHRTEKIFDVSGISTVFYRSERLYDEVLEDTKKISDAIIATKDGGNGYNSIVKIVKANAAIVDTGVVTDQQRFEIILRGIQTDLSQLKRNNLNILNSNKIQKMTFPIDEIKLDELFLKEYRRLGERAISLVDTDNRTEILKCRESMIRLKNNCLDNKIISEINNYVEILNLELARIHKEDSY